MYRPGPVLAQLLREDTFFPPRVAASGATLRIAMVALESGELRFMTEDGTLVDRVNKPVDDAHHDLTTGVLASCSIPAVFRPVPIGGETYVDGGARENLPAELAIGHLGAARNYIVSSQSTGVQRRASMADADLFAIVMRSTEILIDEAGRDELAYAHSAGSIVIYPELSVHDAMTVDPALIAINEAYGWFRAAEQHLHLDTSAEARHRRITELRVRCVQAEREYLASEAPERRKLSALRSVKTELRDAVRSAGAIPLPLGPSSGGARGSRALCRSRSTRPGWHPDPGLRPGRLPGMPDHFPGDPRSSYQRMLDGDDYIADDPRIFEATQRAARLADRYHREVIDGDDAAHATLVELLGDVGEGVGVRPPLFVDLGSNIRIGARTFTNFNLTALDVAPITIGEDCLIGPNVQLLTPTHPVAPGPRRDKVEGSAPITLGDNVWLGGGVIVCPGVSIGDNSVIGAGSVVTRDIPANVVAVGNPARVVRDLT
nr:patatin-like phospholipase family protein [Tessaracoccus coleopterorum]